jgi:hypothetical protein
MGKSPILSLDEENKLMKHLLEVANIGFGYNRKESDYTVTLGKRTHQSLSWENKVWWNIHSTSTTTPKNSYCFRFTSCDTLRVKISTRNNTERCVVG